MDIDETSKVRVRSLSRGGGGRGGEGRGERGGKGGGRGEGGGERGGRGGVGDYSLSSVSLPSDYRSPV